MSERKSAEIKFRCTPTFKAGVQVAAEAASQSMSEYIETAMSDRHTADRRKEENEKFYGLVEFKSGLDTLVPTSPATSTSAGPTTTTITEQREDEPPVDDDGNAVACTCRPWEFCTHKATG